ncbi:MAG: RsmE family RNA methyltransferase [Acidimicrobiia bacterium]
MIDVLRNSKAHIFIDSFDDHISIKDEDFHHLSNVLRLKPSNIISCANNGNFCLYEISEITKTEIRAQRIREVQKDDNAELHVYISAFKLDRLEVGIEKSVEAGATKISIFQTSRSSQSLNESFIEKLHRRTPKIIKSASMQSRRTSLCEIEVIEDIDEVLSNELLPIFICDPEGEVNSVASPCAIIVGPEGGFSQEELEMLKKYGKTWNISPYILRADTAMAVACSIAKYQRI